LLGKTHFAVGVASSLIFTQPKTVQDVILAVGIGGMGALISDIDVVHINMQIESSQWWY
jgi:inner membrane protein